MIFSKDTWATKEGFRHFVNASKALSWETMETPLEQTWMMLFVPMLGQQLADDISAIYEMRAEDRSRASTFLLMYAQMALANLTLWLNYDELNVRLTDQGHQRQESDTFKSLYKYQEDKLRHIYMVKGFNAVDTMLEWLDKFSDDYPSWTDSPANARRQSSVVRCAAEVNDTVFINNSYIVFLRMIPAINRIVDTILPVRLGVELFDLFKSKLSEGSAVVGSTTIEELRSYVRKYVVCLAAAELVKETGSLTDRGLYFDSYVAGKDGNEISRPATREEQSGACAGYFASAERYGHALDNFIEFNIPEYFAGRESDIFKRDNDGKKTVWV